MALIEYKKKRSFNKTPEPTGGKPDTGELGFTWYSLIDQVDWDTTLREDNGKVNSLGLYDINRNIRVVGKAYKKIIDLWQPVLDKEPFGLQL
jgi:hypothetical protein